MNKKILLFCIVNCAFCIVAYAQSSQRMHNLREVVVWGKRPMKDIGVQKTTFDSIALKENIALSMADILTFNSSVFVKSYGRATLSTVAFRGTSPSHTQVTWNGMRINNPMLGMTDFSTIPSYFIDQASLLHGTSSVNETGGGLGGLVRLGTIPDVAEGVNLQYVQGVGSFSTFDEFARFTYGSEHWHVSYEAQGRVEDAPPVPPPPFSQDYLHSVISTAGEHQVAVGFCGKISLCHTDTGMLLISQIREKIIGTTFKLFLILFYVSTKFFLRIRPAAFEPL